jgi:tryptophan synthase alpha chain
VSRLTSTFARLRAERRLALIAYLTVGYPRPDDTPSLVEAAARSGADAIELGIPFSDPLADGRTIQAASQLALKGGMTVRRALEAAAAARKKTEAPLLFMTYLNPILAFGLERFCRAAADAGIDGLIVPDLPPAESAELRRTADAGGVDLVFFVAPTSSEAGIEAACQASTGFVYCIAVTGVTGARAHLDEAVLPLIASVRLRHLQAGAPGGAGGEGRRRDRGQRTAGCHRAGAGGRSGPGKPVPTRIAPANGPLGSVASPSPGTRHTVG